MNTLPQITTPEYRCTLPSNGEEIMFRPFLVKEQKILHIALEGDDEKEITNAMINIVEACIMSDINIKELPSFDIEYLFLNVRAKSVGELIDVIVTCPDDWETEVEVQINIDDINVTNQEGHDKDIQLDDELTLRMKYPSLDEFVKTNFNGEDINVDQGFDIIANCIDQIYSEEESWNTSDCTKKELDEFIGNLTSSQFSKVEKFFASMPKLTHTLKVENPNTKVESEVVLEGLASFFA